MSTLKQQDPKVRIKRPHRTINAFLAGAAIATAVFGGKALLESVTPRFKAHCVEFTMDFSPRPAPGARTLDEFVSADRAEAMARTLNCSVSVCNVTTNASTSKEEITCGNVPKEELSSTIKEKRTMNAVLEGFAQLFKNIMMGVVALGAINEVIMLLRIRRLRKMPEPPKETGRPPEELIL